MFCLVGFPPKNDVTSFMMMDRWNWIEWKIILKNIYKYFLINVLFLFKSDMEHDKNTITILNSPYVYIIVINEYTF